MNEFTTHEASIIRGGVMDDDTSQVVEVADFEILRQQLADVSHERDGLRAAVTELESGLRIIAVCAKGSGLGAMKLVAKQSLNRAFGTASPSADEQGARS
ncbi:hypothetical protein KDX38_10770 [Pseudomonas sp. CDFA 602]|uniref:hypothetical protein n=1 Tax=Pseudomonas californiensis TaxID=2829823 RepID=UPI001E486DC5|nr:hypothetical protein [Pseudomonas californiensis]MCD5994200.1 hypothetical protein [Pseudomonas californiensis]MCD5999701.1 hypothetical protein [Pseudomonas californiensis]